MPRGCYELAGVKRKDAREDRELVLFVNKKNQKNFVTCVYRDRCPCNPPAGTAGGWQGHEPCPKQVTKFFLVLFCSQKRTFGLFHNHKLIKDLKFITPSRSPRLVGWRAQRPSSRSSRNRVALSAPKRGFRRGTPPLGLF